jgi:dihydroflavonol-4-reductase
MPALPNFGGLIVDVRDIADLHTQALIAPQAAGQRLLAVGEFRWLRDIALLLRARLGEQASKVRTRRMPDPVVRLAARFNPDMAYIAASLRHQPRVDGSKVERLLDWRTRPAEQTVLDAANSVLGGLPEEGDPRLAGHASGTLEETSRPASR